MACGVIKLSHRHVYKLLLISVYAPEFLSNNLAYVAVEDKKPLNALIDSESKPLFKTVSFPNNLPISAWETTLVPTDSGNGRRKEQRDLKVA